MDPISMAFKIRRNVTHTHLQKRKGNHHKLQTKYIAFGNHITLTPEI